MYSSAPAILLLAQYRSGPLNYLERFRDGMFNAVRPFLSGTLHVGRFPDGMFCDGAFRVGRFFSYVHLKYTHYKPELQNCL